jgi:hypothetical protein
MKHRKITEPMLLTADEIRTRRAALLYVDERLRRSEWRRDPLVRLLLIREREHVWSEIVRGQGLPFGWRTA